MPKLCRPSITRASLRSTSIKLEGKGEVLLNVENAVDNVLLS